jgi:hypothetical protein
VDTVVVRKISWPCDASQIATPCLCSPVHPVAVPTKLSYLPRHGHTENRVARPEALH